MAKGNGKNGKKRSHTIDSLEERDKLGRRDARDFAVRLAKGLEYHTQDELDELAQQAADSFLNDPDGPFQHIEEESKRKFLRALSVTGVKAKAARLAGLDRTIIYTDAWRGDEEFQEAFEIAELAGADSLIDEMFRRGVEGVEKPVGWYMGEAGGVIREYSDKMLIKLVHASPHGHLFRDRVDIHSKNINFNLDDLDRLPPPVLAAIAAGTRLDVALTEHVERLVASGPTAGQLPSGRDVSPTEDENAEE